jgi:hypothetical protein
MNGEPIARRERAELVIDGALATSPVDSNRQGAHDGLVGELNKRLTEELAIPALFRPEEAMRVSNLRLSVRRSSKGIAIWARSTGDSQPSYGRAGAAECTSSDHNQSGSSELEGS